MSTLKVLKPSTPTFVSSTVAEPASSDPMSAWAVGNAYAAGDTVYVIGTEHRVYECTAAHQGTSTDSVTAVAASMLTIAVPCVVTWNSHGKANGTAVVFTTTGALPAGLTVGTTYYVSGAATNTFNVAATPGGAAITTTGTQSGTHTCKTTSTAPVDRLTGTDPLWLDLGPTNRHAMFDAIISTGTEQSAGHTVTISNASPGVVSWTAHGLPNGSSLKLSTTGALPTGLTVGTTYYVVGAAADTFNLSATLGGTAINTSSAGSGVHTAIQDLCVVVSPGMCNGVATMDVSGVSAVKCEQFNGSTLVFTQTKLVDNTFIDDYYAYFFEPYDVFTDLLFGPLLPYPNCTVKLTFVPTAAGSTVSCGAALYGNTVSLGEVQYGATVGIEDYSRIETDEFGVSTLVERGFLKQASYSINVADAQLRRVFSTLAALRATPSVWTASDITNLSPLNVYGVPTFNINVAYYGYSNVSIEIKGI